MSIRLAYYLGELNMIHHFVREMDERKEFILSNYAKIMVDLSLIFRK